ncbi:hypothetical protein AGR4B_Lc10136 [Agrobacterium tumefaciens str. CFBP 5621]|nr:hypothetical protein AGR4B_Lc10136 [Agrobacterium tumefaciens str. CFBP 5621]
MDGKGSGHQLHSRAFLNGPAAVLMSFHNAFVTVDAGPVSPPFVATGDPKAPGALPKRFSGR